MDDVTKGDRIELVATTDEHTRLQPGDQGTVQRVQAELGQVDVDWDSGSTLSLIASEGDRWTKVGS